MKPRYPNSNMLFTDTDSLAYEIETNDIYEDMSTFSHIFDFSEYPETHPLFSLVNKKLSGKFKDGLAGQARVEFIGLRPKMYWYTYVDRESGIVKEKKIAKGTKNNIKKRFLSHEFYKDALENLSRYSVIQNTFRSDKHIIISINTKRIALSAYDTKRWICADGIHTLAHAH